MSFVSINQFKLVLRYLRYWWKAGNEHDVHSPFVFKLLMEGIYKKDRHDDFQKIESFRKKLLTDYSEINVIDLGAGSSFDNQKSSASNSSRKRSIHEITKKFAKSKKYCEVLFRITNHLKPKLMIELGTSMGISAMYQAAGNTYGLLYTLEGCPETSAKALDNIKLNNFSNIICLTGNFDETLPALLEKIKIADYVFIDGNHSYSATMRYFNLLKNHVNADSVIVFDDINWSEGMQQAWSEIKADENVTITIDLFVLGMVFFNKGFTKQNFILKLK